MLTGLGAGGAIGYVSDNSAKNLTAENLTDLLAHGLSVGLVFEDTETDMRAGAAGGLRHGQVAYFEADTIGYDAENCVIFAADDENTGPADLPAVLAYMDAFAGQVPHPGYYGDQDSIDWLYARRPGWWYWQTNATGWGSGISRNAHLVQRYGDPRAQGRILDVNDIQREGVPFMAIDGFTQADRDKLNGIYSQITAPSGFLARFGVNMAKLAGQMEQAEHADVAAQIAALQTALAGIVGQAGNVSDPHALADLIVAEVAHRLGVAPPA